MCQGKWRNAGERYDCSLYPCRRLGDAVVFEPEIAGIGGRRVL